LAELAEVLAEFSAAGSAVVLAAGSAVVLAEGLAAVLAADLAADLETFGLQDGWLTLSVETPFAGWLWSSWRLLPRNVGIR
jgi:hypothetical protein